MKNSTFLATLIIMMIIIIIKIQVRNALRYFPPSTHAELAPEFAQELAQYGHIYMYRWLHL